MPLQQKPGSSPSLRPSSGPWPVVLAVFLVALLLRVIYLLDAGENPFWRQLGLDLEFYDTWARWIATGHGLGEAPFTQAPLFPLLLGLIYTLLGPDPVRALWVQAFAGAVTAGLVAYIGWRWRGAATGLIAGLLVAAMKPAIFYTGVLLPPVWASLTVALALLLLQRAAGEEGRGPMLAGAALGLAGLAQPTALALLPVALIALHGHPPTRGRQTSPGGIPWRRHSPVRYALGTCAVLALVLLYNGIGGRAWSPIAVNGGINFYIGNHPQATGAYVSPPGLSEEQDLLGVTLASHRAGRTLTPTEASAYWTARAFEFIGREPGRWLGLFLRKVFFALAQPEIPQVEFLDFESRYSSMLRWPLPGMALLVGLAAAGTAFFARRDRWARTLAWGSAALVAGLAVFFITARFRQILLPGLALLGGAAIIETARAPRRALVPVVVGCAAGLLSLANPFGSDRTLPPARAQMLYRLGVIAHEAGRADEAMTCYRDAIALEPRLAKAHLNLAALLVDRGDLTAATAIFREVIGLDPRDVLAWRGLAQTRQRMGDGPGAAEAYAKVLELTPDDFRTREIRAAILYAGGVMEEAASEYERVMRAAPPADPAGARARSLLSIVRTRSTDPNWFEIVALRRGDLLLAQGDSARAVQYYHDAMVEAPPPPLPSVV
jgi:cytochrome c-type biogenesis protein CcmH/NrfG